MANTYHLDEGWERTERTGRCIAYCIAGESALDFSISCIPFLVLTLDFLESKAAMITYVSFLSILWDLMSPF